MDQPNSSPFFEFLNQINAAANGGLHLLAISSAVALPDICVSLISDDGRTDANRYKEWCVQNLGLEFSYVTPKDLYSMRCGVLHNGRFGDLKHSVKRVIFMPPGDNNFVNCVMNDAYVYNVVEFCSNMTMAVHRWFQANRDNPVVQANTDRLMQYRAGGFEQYFHGLTVIA